MNYMIAKETYQKLVGADVTKHTAAKKILYIGLLIDASSDAQDYSGIKKAVEISHSIDRDGLDGKQQVALHYFLANAYSLKYRFSQSKNFEAWDNFGEELSNELLHLRSCIANNSFSEIDKGMQCQIYTNLGNHFSQVGRFVEAQDLWKKAIKLNSKFAMALGNMAIGYQIYADQVYDESHKNILIYHAYNTLKGALSLDEFLDTSAKAIFNSLYKSIRDHWPKSYLEKGFSFDFDLGKDYELADYRKWCLNMTLYLNPINDISAYPLAAQDVLHLPSMVMPVNAKPKYHSLFNQIKQEFGTSRFLLYEGTQLPTSSYSDRDISLVDTFEYEEYSYNLEKVKIAYRLVYSLFDKLAYLLNDYLEIGLNQNTCSFRKIWHRDTERKILRPIFNKNDNLALQGLYWLSKDLFDVNETYSDVLEPEAKQLSAIRNHIEHKSFRVLQYGNWGVDDGFTFSIGRDRLEEKTMKQIKLARAAIIYTSLAIHHIELKREHDGITVPTIMPDLPFDDKV